MGSGPDAARSKRCRAAQSYAREGKTWVVDMDITKFFDHVNHDILMKRIGDGGAGQTSARTDWGIPAGGSDDATE